jgi:hypothetical protein
VLQIHIEQQNFQSLCSTTTISFQFYIVTDMINTLPGNSSVNTIQHATIDEAMFTMLSALSSSGTMGLCNPLLRKRFSKHISAYWTVLWECWHHQQQRWCFPWGLYRMFIREANAEASSDEGSYESVISWRNESRSINF